MTTTHVLNFDGLVFGVTVEIGRVTDENGRVVKLTPAQLATARMLAGAKMIDSARDDAKAAS